MILVRGGAAITGTALLAAAMWLYAVRPGVQAKELDPIRTEGRVGAVVSTGDFRVRVDSVTAARSLKSTLGAPERTEGIFLIVGFQAMARKEPVKLQSVVLETPDGFTFRPGPRLGVSAPTANDYQPLLWSRSSYVFEVPRDAVAGARLVVGTGGLLPQLSAAADIDLGLTGAKAAELLGGAAESYDPRARP
ncbi:hypothetical protein [Spirillospora sp. NPDC029432]|uniref:hypothetical protein n=1 Tax=Spirillospora sp. NPDC029432 TaxID=3154599 RepID=UPI003456A940